MTAPGGVIATVYVDVLPRVNQFATELRRSLRQSSRELRAIDRELAPVQRGLESIARAATGIVPGVQLARTSLIALGAHTVLGGLLSAAGAATTLSGALGVVPAAGVAAASAIGALSVGLFGVQDALKKFDEVDKFNAKLELLSENARNTLGVINEFRTELTDFRDAVQDQLFEGLDEVARDLVTTFLPRLQTHFTNIAATINGTVRDLAAFAQTAETLADVDEVTANTEASFNLLRTAIIPAATAFRDIVAVGSRFLPEIAREVQLVAVEFSEWVQVMRATGELEVIIRRGIDAAGQLFTIFSNVGRAASATLQAAQESGNGFLDTLERLTASMADFLESARGQELIGDFLDSARAGAEALSPVLLSLVDLFVTDVFPILENFATTLGPVVAQFFAGLGDALDIAAPGISAFASGFATFVRSITPVLPLLGQLLGELGRLFGALAAQFGPAIAEVATAVGSILIPILQLLTTFVQNLSPEFFKLVVVIGTVVAGVTALIGVIRGLEAVGILFAGFAKNMTTGLSKTQGAATGLIGFLSGPWGIAIGLATTALGLFLSSTEDNAAEQREFASAAQDLNAVIREQGNVINGVVREKAALQLEEQGLLDLAQRSGVALSDVTDAYINQGRSLDGLLRQLDAIIKANTTVVTDAEGVTNVVYNEQAQAAADLRDKLTGLVAERDKDAAAQRRQKDAAIGFVGPAQLVTTALEAQRAAIQAVTDAHARQAQQELESLNADIAYFNQLDRTNAELNEGTKTLDIHSQEGRDNLAVISQLAQAGIQRIANLREQGASTAEVTALTQQHRNALIDMVAPFFSSRDAAAQYLETLGLIPRNVTTTVFLDISNVLTQAQRAANVIASLPGALFGVGGRAHGGPTQPGEWAIVGEEGPELVRFGRTARVFSNDESERMVRDVGELDTLTTRGTPTTRAATTTGTGTASVVQVDNRLNVEPNVRVYVDGRELRGMVRVELDERDRRMRRLITTSAGGRGV